CALKDGGAWCWGHNYYGQLGNGTTTSSNVPVQVLGMEGVPVQHKVLFVDGIGSSSRCNNTDDYGGKTIVSGTTDLRDHLRGIGATYEWVGPQTGLDAPDDFLFYEYTELIEGVTRDGCAGSSSPNYRNRESCWSLNDTGGSGWSQDESGQYYWENEMPIPNGGQGRRFANFVTKYLYDNPGVVLSIIGFSQGGVIATYAIDEGLIPSAYRPRIRTIVTLDSPFGPLANEFTVATNEIKRRNRCPDDSLYDSAYDFRLSSDVIRNIQDHRPPPGGNPRPRLFTVNEEPGIGGCARWGVEVCVGVPDWNTKVKWESGHLSVGAQDHGDILRSEFTSPNEEEKFLLFVACALRGLLDCRGAAEDLIRLPPTMELPAGALKEIAPGTGQWGMGMSYQGIPGGGGLAPQMAEQSSATSLSVSNFSTTLIDPNGVNYTAASLPPATRYEAGNGYESFMISDPLPGTWTIQVATTDPLGAIVDVWQTTTLSAQVDSDGDNVANDNDNCPGAANPSQVDTDGDALGDACDDDLDNDTITNATDNCLFASNTAQDDVDADGLGDACDSDSDNDLVDDDDEVIAGTNSMNPDSDGDGEADGTELYFGSTDPLNPDTDGDGISDGLLAVPGPPAVAAGPDNCPTWPNTAQALPAWPVPLDDADCDGFTSVSERLMGTDPAIHCNATATVNDEADAWPSD
ncbi:MAG: thrombospondin type 3 repeat-containing protein, partial [Dehalococcoidia bacterium]